MFEVGKLSDETLDSFLAELEKVRIPPEGSSGSSRSPREPDSTFTSCHLPSVCLQVESTAEGEAQRYFDHALTLKNTILFLRYNKELTQDQGPDIPNIGDQETAVVWNLTV